MISVSLARPALRSPAPAAAARRQTCRNAGRSSPNMGTKKAVTRVSAGHGLDLWRARRDSNP